MLGIHDVAIKVLKAMTSPRDLGLLQREVAVLRSCNNNNIVRFYGLCFKDPDVWLVLELLENGTLYHALLQGKQQINWYNRYASTRSLL